MLIMIEEQLIPTSSTRTKQPAVTAPLSSFHQPEDNVSSTIHDLPTINGTLTCIGRPTDNVSSTLNGLPTDNVTVNYNDQTVDNASFAYTKSLVDKSSITSIGQSINDASSTIRNLPIDNVSFLHKDHPADNASSTHIGPTNDSISLTFIDDNFHEPITIETRPTSSSVRQSPCLPSQHRDGTTTEGQRVHIVKEREDCLTTRKIDVESRSKVKLWRRDPVPMKYRALPQSFWQQPNNTNCQSPGAVYPVLPPWGHMDKVDEPTAASYNSGVRTVGDEKTSKPNTDLLFSLFQSVEKDKKRITVVRRGRPRKSQPSCLMTRVLRDDDPYLISAVTESILPLIPNSRGSGTRGYQGSSFSSNQGQQMLAMVSLSDGDKTLSLPSIDVQHNYSHLLSELVIKL